MFRLRLLTQDDLPQTVELCRFAGWNQTEEDWSRIIRYQPEGCFAAVKNNAVIGTVTSTSYGAQLAWIGMMLVHPEHRRQGIGEALIQQCISFLKERSTISIMLDATPAGQPLYEKIGFHSQCRLQRWHRISPPTEEENLFPKLDSANRLGESCRAVDRNAFGCDRSFWLDQLSKVSLMVMDHEGFAMLRSGHLANYLGPVSATRPEIAEGLIHQLVLRSNRDLFWDILEENQAAQVIARRLGFIPVRELTRMYLGYRSSKGDPRMIFGLADPAVG